MANVVIDTNVLVSALWSADGNPAKIVRLIPDKKAIPHFSREILLEYQTVLSRPAFRFSHEQVDTLLKKLLKYGNICQVTKSGIALPDESDRVFYDVAKSCEAILITGNKKHYPNEAFIVTPKDFLIVAENSATDG